MKVYLVIFLCLFLSTCMVNKQALPDVAKDGDIFVQIESDSMAAAPVGEDVYGVVVDEEVIHEVGDAKSSTPHTKSENDAANGSGNGTNFTGNGSIDGSPNIVIGNKGEYAFDTLVAAPTIDVNESNIGAVAYYVPPKMKVGEKYKINLRISKKLSKMLSAGLPDSAVVKPIRIGRTMSAVITDASPDEKSFEIQPLNTAVQSIENDSSYTIWEWSIMPIKSGEHRLKLSIVIREADLVKDIPVYEDNIQIEASPIFTAGKFVTDNWKEIGSGFMSSIAIPLVVWWWNKRKKKKNETV